MRNLLLGAAVVAMTTSGAVAKPDNRGRDKDRGAQVSARAEARANVRENRRERAERRENRSERRAERRDNRSERSERRGGRRDDRADNRREVRLAANARAQSRARERAEDRREARAEARVRANVAERRADNRREARADARARARAAERRADNRREARQDRREDRRDAVRDARRRAERRDDRRDNIRERRAERRENIRERRAERREDRREARRDWRQDRRVIRQRDRDYWRFVRLDRERGLINGCPPGLAKKWNGCMPPGQARKRYRDYRSAYGYVYRPRLFGLTNYYDDARYSYDDGYLYRLGSNGGIAGYIPLLGGALAIGNPWPASYRSYNVPDYYVDYYNLGGPRGYRYADNVLYRVDGDDMAITAIAALLTGNEIQIGQPMPMGYDVYNVPYPYRDRYYDTPDAYYRYSDGYVYRIDPETQLVAAAINLLTNGNLAAGQPAYNRVAYGPPVYDRFVVGQPMPVGYDVYNVPYGYRDRYYDTPDAYYRYSDGYVYRIDPETQLVAAAIDLVI